MKSESDGAVAAQMGQFGVKDDARAATLPEQIEPFGFPCLNLGLNNQKIAVLGLFTKAMALNRPIALPEFSNFDSVGGNHSSVPFDRVYSRDSMLRLADAFGCEVIDGPPVETTNGWHCFVGGAETLGRESVKGLSIWDDFVPQFFRHMVPHITRRNSFESLAEAVFKERKIQLVCQLRIEKDWAEHAENVRRKNQGFAEHDAPSFTNILTKIRNTIPDKAQRVYVVCDEANLPVSKAEIRAEVLRRFGISLFWKSDLLPPETLALFSTLDLSIIDFEMAVRAPIFVGLSQSTFSNLVYFETVFRAGNKGDRQYIYNVPGDMLARRFDYGAAVDVSIVTDNLLERAALVEDSPDDCLWPAKLTAHFAVYGDFTSATARLPGVRHGYLAAGVRRDPVRRIEGFTIELSGALPGNVEYRVKSGADWSPWVPGGAFAGSRGKSQALNGYAVRLTGQLALSYECVCVGSFTGHEAVVQTGGAEDCCTADGAALEAMQVIFRPMILDKSPSGGEKEF